MKEKEEGKTWRSGEGGRGPREGVVRDALARQVGAARGGVDGADGGRGEADGAEVQVHGVQRDRRRRLHHLQLNLHAAWHGSARIEQDVWESYFRPSPAKAKKRAGGRGRGEGC